MACNMQKECRDDNENHIVDDTMPNVIHLAPTLQVSSPNEPVIIEDLTGYEILRGEYSIVIANEECEENLIVGKRLGSMKLPSLGQRQSITTEQQDNSSQQRPLTAKHGDVAKAISLLALTNNLSDITFKEEKDGQLAVFERVRMSL